MYSDHAVSTSKTERRIFSFKILLLNIKLMIKELVLEIGKCRNLTSEPSKTRIEHNENGGRYQQSVQFYVATRPLRLRLSAKSAEPASSRLGWVARPSMS